MVQTTSQALLLEEQACQLISGNTGKWVAIPLQKLNYFAQNLNFGKEKPYPLTIAFCL